jgi:nicotinamidase-related amidase
MTDSIRFSNGPASEEGGPSESAPEATSARALWEQRAQARPRGPRVRVERLPLARLRRADSLLLLVDVQSPLLDAVRFGARVAQRSVLLAQAALALDVPVVATAQNPSRLGPLCPELLQVLESAPSPIRTHSKMKFSALTDEVAREIELMARPTIVVAGLESHVCVLQSVLDLLERAKTVFVARDAISSRRARDEEAAWERMMQAGAHATTAEGALFEWLGDASHPAFKALLPLVK